MDYPKIFIIFWEPYSFLSPPPICAVQKPKEWGQGEVSPSDNSFMMPHAMAILRKLQRCCPIQRPGRSSTGKMRLHASPTSLLAFTMCFCEYISLYYLIESRSRMTTLMHRRLHMAICLYVFIHLYAHIDIHEHSDEHIPVCPPTHPPTRQGCVVCVYTHTCCTCVCMHVCKIPAPSARGSPYRH